MDAQRSLRAEDVIAEVEAGWGRPCPTCSEALLGHDVVISLLMGHKDSPRCGPCLAASMRRPRDEFLRRARSNVSRLECYRAGWLHADRRLDGREARAAAWAREFPLDEFDDEEFDEAPRDEATGVELRPSAFFDAGDMGCGDLVLLLRAELQGIEPGQVLEVRATDPGAPVDLPAWARLTRNSLVRQDTPLYWFRRRRD